MSAPTGDVLAGVAAFTLFGSEPNGIGVNGSVTAALFLGVA
jgi:hypothetical protein